MNHVVCTIFFAWLLSLSIMYLLFIHVVVCIGRVLFVVVVIVAEQYTIEYTTVYIFTY